MSRKDVEEPGGGWEDLRAEVDLVVREPPMDGGFFPPVNVYFIFLRDVFFFFKAPTC